MSTTGGLDARIVVHRDDGFTLDAAFSIDPGTTVAVLGPNGAGKSTAVDVLAGLLPLDEGRIELAGRVLDDPTLDLHVPPEDRRVGVVFQDYLLFEHLGVIDNVAFGRSSGRSRAAARAEVGPWMEALGLTELADRRPSSLSGGQAQRVALARALATDPDLLLLDEPLAALDVSTRGELRRLLRSQLRTRSGPTLLITHDPADAFLLADRVEVLENGTVTQSGRPDDIRRRPATPYVAALAGLNLLTGTNTAGTLTLERSRLSLQTADAHTAGPVLITIPPAAVALHPDEPHGSPRNVWPTTVAFVEPLGEITRITLGDPLPLSADVTPAAVASLGLEPGTPVWASVKATEIAVNPA